MHHLTTRASLSPALNKNRRAAADEGYAKFLLGLGCGGDADESSGSGCEHTLLVPTDAIKVTTDVDTALRFAHPDVTDADACATSMVITPLNDTVQQFNERYLTDGDWPDDAPPVKTLLAGVRYTFDKDEETNFRNTNGLFSQFGLPSDPPHELKLREGCIVSLIRNVDLDNRLANGTMLKVLEIKPMLLTCKRLQTPAEVAAGVPAYVFDLPKFRFRIRFDQRNGHYFLRTQFPVRVAYSGTVHRSQSRTLARAVVDLRYPVFTHGQAYSAWSRVKTRGDIMLLASPDQLEMHDGKEYVRVRNIVFKRLIADDSRADTAAT